MVEETIMKFSKASIYSKKNIYLKINKNHWQNKKKRGKKKIIWRHVETTQKDCSRAQTGCITCTNLTREQPGKWCDSTHSIVWEWVVTKLLFDFLFHFIGIFIEIPKVYLIIITIFCLALYFRIYYSFFS